MSTTNRQALLRNSAMQRPDYRKDMFGNRQPAPPPDVLDAIAEQKLTAGYNVRRSNRCDTCYEYKSVNGSCSCQ